MRIVNELKNFLKSTRIYHPLRTLRFNVQQKKAVEEWEKRGRPIPPPHFIKQKSLLEYAHLHNLRIFVETGTFYGDMVHAMKPFFAKLYSIELDPVLFTRAKARFRSCNHIQIIHGDSGEELGKIVPHLNQPALFWLDGHYSGTETAKGEVDTPIYRELHHILNAQPMSHVIIIDDARCFGTDASYPSISNLTAFIRSKRPHMDLTVQDDSIRIVI